MSVTEAVTLADVTGTNPIGTALLDLNNAHAVELSWLEPDRLRHLVAEAALARRIGDADALLLAFDESADYDSPNFLWFRARLRRFLYVDRIVVAPHARGRGHASALYRELFDHAVRAGYERVVCEVNSDPPNPASDAFHAEHGFTEMGMSLRQDGKKTVRYLVRPMAP
jgi:predicted GNAT superfamily acetyltransferase